MNLIRFHIIWVGAAFTILSGSVEITAGAPQIHNVGIGRIQLPINCERKDYPFVVAMDDQYSIELQAENLPPFLDESIELCQSDEDSGCLLKAELGSLPWKLFENGVLVHQGNIDTLNFSRHQTLGLVSLRMISGRQYLLSFYRSAPSVEQRNARNFAVVLQSFD